MQQLDTLIADLASPSTSATAVYKALHLLAVGELTEPTRRRLQEAIDRAPEPTEDPALSARFW